MLQGPLLGWSNDRACHLLKLLDRSNVDERFASLGGRFCRCLDLHRSDPNILERIVYHLEKIAAGGIVRGEANKRDLLRYFNFGTVLLSQTFEDVRFCVTCQLRRRKVLQEYAHCDLEVNRDLLVVFGYRLRPPDDVLPLL